MSVSTQTLLGKARNWKKDNDSGNTPSVTGSTGSRELDKVIALAGYSYDPSQDIFFSTMDPWQRNVGYCRLYDEAAAPFGMIIDSEPIYFEYQRKKWMIGIWKGQYDLVTGGEIGVYTSALKLNLPGIFSGTFYHSARNDERLTMSFTLRKNGEPLFTREDTHWWLTGFVLGEFSEPSELSMDIRITLTNEAMRDAFVAGLHQAGYTDHDLRISANTVQFIFAAPHIPQPATRTPASDYLIQQKNKLLCDEYQKVTGDYTTVPEKIMALREQAPKLYDKIFRIGKSSYGYEIILLIIIASAAILFCLTLEKDADEPLSCH